MYIILCANWCIYFYVLCKVRILCIYKKGKRIFLLIFVRQDGVSIHFAYFSADVHFLSPKPVLQLCFFSDQWPTQEFFSEVNTRWELWRRWIKRNERKMNKKGRQKQRKESESEKTRERWAKENYERSGRRVTDAKEIRDRWAKEDYKRKSKREKKKNAKKKTTQGKEELWLTRKKWEKTMTRKE